MELWSECCQRSLRLVLLAQLMEAESAFFRLPTETATLHPTVIIIHPTAAHDPLCLIPLISPFLPSYFFFFHPSPFISPIFPVCNRTQLISVLVASSYAIMYSHESHHCLSSFSIAVTSNLAFSVCLTSPHPLLVDLLADLRLVIEMFCWLDNHHMGLPLVSCSSCYESMT